MSSDLKVLQVIPKLGYGGAETGCYDIAPVSYTHLTLPTNSRV